ncbi:MAG: transporter [Acidiferrobacter sp.]
MGSRVTTTIVFLLACQSAWASSPWTLGNLPAYYQGNFGSKHTIGIFYDPTYLQYQNATVRLKLTIPYIAVSNLPRGAKLTSGTLAAHTKNTATTNASGLGDIWLAAHYTLIPESGLRPALVPYAKIKLGTASASEGLGTGRNDYEFGLGLNTTIGANIFPFAHVGYRFVGSPPGQTLQNIATYDAGVSVAATRRDIFTVMYSGEQSEQAGYAGPADAIVAWNYNVTAAGSGFQVYVDKGLSNGSAKFGVGIGGQVVF